MIVSRNEGKWVEVMMERYVFGPLEVPKEQIKAFADTLYEEAKRVNNYEAISFAIYFSLKYDFQLSSLDIDWVIGRRDCVMLLMTWLYYLKANHGKKQATELKPLKKEAIRLQNTDMDSYWIFCYEVLPAEKLHEEWKGLKQAGVSFLRTFA